MNDTKTTAPEAGKAVEAMEFAKQALEAAEEELRLIREKDSAAVYSPMLRPVTLPLAVQKLVAALASVPAPSGADEPVAWRDVLAERQRQISAEGWTVDHDDEHDRGEMARAAGCYALHGFFNNGKWQSTRYDIEHYLWPWSLDSWKPQDARRNLVKAGALILAEIERLDRIGDAVVPTEGIADGPVEIEIERLRLAAFHSNNPKDIDAYYLAVSKWFQDRHYRALTAALSQEPGVAEGKRAPVDYYKVLKRFAEEDGSIREGRLTALSFALAAEPLSSEEKR